MFKKICISLVVTMILLGSLFNVSRVYAQATPTDPIPTVTYDSAADPTPAPTSSTGVIGFKACAFNSGGGNNSNALKSCIEDVLKFLFVIGIFLMVFRIAYIGINKLNPEGGDEKEQVNLIRDVIIGLVLLGAPALVLGAVNQNLLNLNFLDFTGLTGGPKPQVATISKSNVKSVIGAPTNPAYASVGTPFEAATGTVNRSGGRVTSINLTSPGSGYRSTPTITVSGGGGTGAKASPVLQGGKIVGANITNGGSGYTSDPTITFDGGKTGDDTTVTYDTPFVDPAIQGIRLTSFEPSVSGFQTLIDTDTSFLDPSKGGSFDITKIGLYKQIGAVVGAEASCRDMFVLSRYTKKDCDALDVKGVDGKSFRDILATVPQNIKNRFYGDINYYLGSNTGTKAVGFTNRLDIEAISTGAQTSYFSSSELTGVILTKERGCAFGIGCSSYQEPETRSLVCAENYFSADFNGYPVKFATTDCARPPGDYIISDESGLTEIGSYKKTECVVFRGCRDIDQKIVLPKSKKFPAGSQFKRSIKYT